MQKYLIGKASKPSQACFPRWPSHHPSGTYGRDSINYSKATSASKVPHRKPLFLFYIDEWMA